MDRFRYVAGLLVLLTVPLALIAWLVVHPFIRFWRGLGAKVTYFIMAPLLTATLIATYCLRRELFGSDFGTNWLLFAVGVLFFVVSSIIGFEFRKYFPMKTLLGLPEIKGENSPQTLVTVGIYSRIRHPRYLSILLGLLGLALMANYQGIYLAFAVFVPGLYIIIVLEERELVQRFGAAYVEYCQRVPRLIPRFRG